MVPVVRVNDAAFADLRIIATWLGTETPSQTIDAIVRQTMDQLGLERDMEHQDATISTSPGPMEFDNVPGLTFTKPLAAKVNGKAIRSPRWSAILLAMIAQIKARGFEADKLVKELNVPARAGRYEEGGFKYHSGLGISVQGQSASDAWREIDRIANKWSIPVTVEFWWRQNPKAQHPGRTGVLRSGGA